MDTKQYTTVDKSGWPRGEWDDEPDKKQWPDKATGLPCLVVRGPSGALCGYVGIDDTHPLHAIEYSAIDVDIDVHGGLTFSRGCDPSEDESQHVCHVPNDGEPDDVWWFGFDCAHDCDVTPVSDRGSDGYRSYRNVRYVENECRRLAYQLNDAKKAA